VAEIVTVPAFAATPVAAPAAPPDVVPTDPAAPFHWIVPLFVKVPTSKIRNPAVIMVTPLLTVPLLRKMSRVSVYVDVPEFAVAPATVTPDEVTNVTVPSEPSP
jgi:hypothetical protein